MCVLHLLVGFWLVLSSVQDREIGSATQTKLSAYLISHEGDDDTSTVEIGADSIEKLGRFSTTLSPNHFVDRRNVDAIFEIGFVSAWFFVVTALTVGKPKFPTIYGVVVTRT